MSYRLTIGGDMRASIWKHKKLYKGKLFYANYELDSAGKRMIKFKDIASGKELKHRYKSFKEASSLGWIK